MQMARMIRLCLGLLPSSDLATETSFDSGDTSSTAARITGDEVQAVFSLVEFGVGAATRFAGNVFNYMSVSVGVT